MSVSLYLRADLFNLANWSQEWYFERSEDSQAHKFYILTCHLVLANGGKSTPGPIVLLLKMQYTQLLTIHIKIFFWKCKNLFNSFMKEYYSLVSYTSNNFLNDYFWKIFAVLVVVCEGLPSSPVKQAMIACLFQTSMFPY